MSSTRRHDEVEGQQKYSATAQSTHRLASSTQMASVADGSGNNRSQSVSGHPYTTTDIKSQVGTPTNARMNTMRQHINHYYHWLAANENSTTELMSSSSNKKLLSESAIVMLTKVKQFTLNSSDTQRTQMRHDLCSFSPKSSGLNAPKMMMVQLLSSCYLLLILTALGQCAPTTSTVSHHQHQDPSTVLLSNRNIDSIISDVPNHPVQYHAVRPTQIFGRTTAATTATTTATKQNDQVDMLPIIGLDSVNLAHLESSEREPSSSRRIVLPARPSVAHQDSFNGFIAVAAPDADDRSNVDDETILLVLAEESSPSSLRRLIKRSGISDQRLAEIQMIRALKKQLERAANKIATESGGNGEGQGDASTEAS